MKDDNYVLSMSSLAKGIYIVNIGIVSYKIVNK